MFWFTIQIVYKYFTDKIICKITICFPLFVRALNALLNNSFFIQKIRVEMGHVC